MCMFACVPWLGAICDSPCFLILTTAYSLSDYVFCAWACVLVLLFANSASDRVCAADLYTNVYLIIRTCITLCCSCLTYAFLTICAWITKCYLCLIVCVLDPVRLRYSVLLMSDCMCPWPCVLCVQLGAPQQKPKRLRLLADLSGSMYRFNGVDGRLERSMEAVCMVMEALESYEHRFKVSNATIHLPPMPDSLARCPHVHLFCMPPISYFLRDQIANKKSHVTMAIVLLLRPVT